MIIRTDLKCFGISLSATDVYYISRTSNKKNYSYYMLFYLQNIQRFKKII